MSEKITISESELNKMILKEVNRVKRIVMLESEKKSVLKKLNELYESEEVDEIFGFGKPKIDWNDRNSVVQAMTKVLNDRFPAEKMQAWAKKGITREKNFSWSIPGNPMFEKAVDAAIRFKNVDIQWDGNKKDFVPLNYDIAQHTFGGGAEE